LNSIFKAYNYLWFCGLASSGKTLALSDLKKKMSEVDFLSDSIEILDYIEKDSFQKHHIKTNNGGFIVTDSSPFIYSVKTIISKLYTKNRAIIEISRGIDYDNIVDLSYSNFFELMPREIKKKSLVIYIQTDIKKRFYRNNKRKNLDDFKNSDSDLKSFHCPAEAMKRFFSKDDFFNMIKKEEEIDFIILNNNNSKELYLKKIRRFFL
jgi:hypothetical protein